MGGSNLGLETPVESIFAPPRHLPLDAISFLSQAQGSMVVPSLNNTKPNPSPNPHPNPSATKFLCSYGGRILPRYPDGKLRYHGGATRVLAVNRSISFSELLVKLGELCGTSVSLKCQLPTEDLDALVSITSDEDLANLMEEYDRVAPPPSSLKIRAFLFPPKSAKKISPPPSTASSSLDAAWTRPPLPSAAGGGSVSRYPAASDGLVRRIKAPVVFPVCYEKSAGKLPHHAFRAYGNPSHMCHIPQ